MLLTPALGCPVFPPPSPPLVLSASPLLAGSRAALRAMPHPSKVLLWQPPTCVFSSRVPLRRASLLLAVIAQAKQPTPAPPRTRLRKACAPAPPRPSVLARECGATQRRLGAGQQSGALPAAAAAATAAAWKQSMHPPPRTEWTRRVRHPVLIGHAAWKKSLHRLAALRQLVESALRARGREVAQVVVVRRDVDEPLATHLQRAPRQMPAPRVRLVRGEGRGVSD